MKLTQRKDWLVFSAMVAAVVLSVALLMVSFVTLLTPRAQASTLGSSGIVTIDELYDNPANVQKLYNYLAGGTDNDVTYDTIKYLAAQTGGYNATAIRQTAYKKDGVTQKASGKDVVVYFGGMAWDVCLLSLADCDKDGTLETPILTLMLAESSETGTWCEPGTEVLNDETGGSDYETTLAAAYPQNMYGTSYVRAVGLNNGGYYALTTDTLTATKLDPDPTHTFAPFTVAKTELATAVTDALVTPRQVFWQKNGEDAKSFLTRFDCACANDNWGEVSNEWFQGNNNEDRSVFNYCTKNHNDDWADDYLWLPSMTEVGVGMSPGEIGLWGLNKSQRQFSSTYMLRSARNKNTYNIYGVNTTGGHVIEGNLLTSYELRPALHVNLAAPALAPKTMEPLAVSPVSVEYSGTVQRINADNAGWFNQDLTINYYQGQQRTVAPLAVGDYDAVIEQRWAAPVKTTFTITPKSITYTGTLTVENKTYDGTTDVAVSGLSLDSNAIIGEDDVRLQMTGTLATSNATNEADVTVQLALTGLNQGNYKLTGEKTLTKKIAIARQPIVVSGITAANKVYDQTTTADLNFEQVTLAGLIPTDDLHVTAVGTFTKATCDTMITVLIDELTLTGDAVANYVLATEGQQSATWADITPRPLTVTINDVSHVARESDDRDPLSAIVTAGQVFAGDEDNLYTLDTNANPRQPGSYDITWTVNNSNYDIIFVNDKLAYHVLANDSINATNVQVTYDGAPKTLATLTDKPAWYMVTDSFVYRQNGVEVTPVHAGTYEVTVKRGPDRQETIALTIMPRPVTITGITAQNKPYDQNPTATLVYTDVEFDGKIDGDVLTVTAQGSFAQINAGTDLTVTISDWVLGGMSVGDYVLAATGHATTTTANITPIALTVIIAPQSSMLNAAVVDLTAEIIAGEPIGDDTLASICRLTTTADTAVAGRYDIAGEVINDNYTVTFVGGTNAYEVVAPVIEPEPTPEVKPEPAPEIKPQPEIVIQDQDPKLPLVFILIGIVIGALLTSGTAISLGASYFARRSHES